MLVGAGIVDGLQMLISFLSFTVILIPFVWGLSLLLSIGFYMIYGLWFAVNRVSPFSGLRGITRTLMTSCAEVAPLIGNFFPSLFIWTLLTIKHSRQEDEKRAVQNAKIQEAKEREYMNRMRMRERQQQMLIAEQIALTNTAVSYRPPHQQVV